MSKFELYDLAYAAPQTWVGWWCRHDGRRYRETAVVVPDLMALPRTALVRVENMRWTRP